MRAKYENAFFQGIAMLSMALPVSGESLDGQVLALNRAIAFIMTSVPDKLSITSEDIEAARQRGIDDSVGIMAHFPKNVPTRIQ